MDGGSSAFEAREALGRIVQSRLFARASQLRRLLSYLVETTLAGSEAALKESVIGVDVFDLPADFDPKVHPIVRMGMRRLRGRLQQYYESVGAGDRILISLEPGHYTPRFLTRNPYERQRISLAVLPFETSATTDREMSGFLREALLTRLGKNPLLHLVGSESASMDTHAFDTDHLPKTARAAFVMQGSYVAGGETIQVAPELVSCDDNQRFALGIYQQVASADVWLVQDEIANAVEKRIFAKSDKQKNSAQSSAAPERGLNRLIVQGRYHLHQNSSESLQKSVECFKTAIKQQPSLAIAWAGLSITQMVMVMYHMVPAEQAWRSAFFAANKAVEFDPALVETQLALAFLDAIGRFRPVDAGLHFERALAANAGDNSLRIAYAMTHLAPLGRLQEAEDQLDTVLANDPLNAKALQMMALIAYFNTHFDESAELALSALDLLPRSVVAVFILANCYDRLGLQEKALQQYRKCEELLPLARLLKWSSVMAAIYKGRTKWVRPTVLAAVKVLQSSSRPPAAMIADLLIRLGETERAVQWMERAFSDKAFRGLFLGVDPCFQAIRADPRCVVLLHQLQSASSSCKKE